MRGGLEGRLLTVQVGDHVYHAPKGWHATASSVPTLKTNLWL